MDRTGPTCAVKSNVCWSHIATYGYSSYTSKIETHFLELAGFFDSFRVPILLRAAGSSCLCFKLVHSAHRLIPGCFCTHCDCIMYESCGKEMVGRVAVDA
eukprot:1191116-Prorocentrum_minimum.AAC.1